MKAVLFALLLIAPVAAHAASPEDGYIAARDKYIAKFKASDKLACFVAVRPPFNFHLVELSGEDGNVERIRNVARIIADTFDQGNKVAVVISAMGHTTDELVTLARNYTDEVAERANAIGVSPNGKARTVVESSGIPDYPEGWRTDEDTVEAMVDTLAALIRKLRKGIDETDKSDLVTQDLLIQITQELEKAHWMWQAQRA